MVHRQSTVKRFKVVLKSSMKVEFIIINIMKDIKEEKPIV